MVSVARYLTRKGDPFADHAVGDPSSWTVLLAPGGTSEHPTYQLDVADGRSFIVDAHHGGSAHQPGGVALGDLVQHAKDFLELRGFTYSTLEGDDVIGCIYIYPDRLPGHDAEI